MPKDTKSLGNNKAPACESRGFVYKKEGVHFDTPSLQYVFNGLIIRIQAHSGLLRITFCRPSNACGAEEG